jgi:hypothetical protein
MKIIKLNTDLKVVAIPRTMPPLGEVLNFKAINEFSQFEISLTVDWWRDKDRIVFILPINSNYKAANKYEISIRQGTTTIYEGKMLVVKEITDTQNYTPSKQRPQRFK